MNRAAAGTDDHARWVAPSTGVARSRWRQAVARYLMPAHSLVLAVIFAGSLVVAWAVLPGEDERIEALERDGQTARAFAMLEARFARGDRRQRTLVALRRFYDYYGDSDKSRDMLELLAVQRPRDLYIQRQLAQHYRMVQDLPAQLHALRAQLAIRYSEPVCQRLIGLLHQSNDFSAEQQALIECHDNGYRRPEGLVRLASLFAADGRFDKTADILAAVDDRRWLSGSHERLMLFDALMGAEKPREALRRAIRWYKGAPDPDLALEMISRLMASGHNDYAMQLAREVGTPGDAVSLAVAEILIDQVQLEAARAFLTGWLAQAQTLPTEAAVRFVAAAVDAGDPALALKGAERRGLERFMGADLVPLAEALFDRGAPQDFDRIVALLQPDVIEADGLLAAAVDVRSGRLEAARTRIADVAVDVSDERRMALKARLAALVGPNQPPGQRPLHAAPTPDVVLVPPTVSIAPGETQTSVQGRRPQGAVEVSKRFKRTRPRRLIGRTTTPQPQVQPVAPAKPIVVPPAFQ